MKVTGQGTFAMRKNLVPLFTSLLIVSVSSSFAARRSLAAPDEGNSTSLVSNTIRTSLTVTDSEHTIIDVLLNNELIEATWMQLCCYNNISHCFALEEGAQLLIPAPVKRDMYNNCSAVVEYVIDGEFDSEYLKEELDSLGYTDGEYINKQVSLATLLYKYSQEEDSVYYEDRGVADWVRKILCPPFAKILETAYTAGAALSYKTHGHKRVGALKGPSTTEYRRLNCAFKDVFARSEVYFHYCAKPIDFIGKRKRCLPWPLRKVCVTIGFTNPAAMTFGNRVYYKECNPTAISFQLMAHEMQHVRQYLAQGSMGRMGYTYMLGWCKAGPSYEGNWMEKEARNVAAKAKPC